MIPTGNKKITLFGNVNVGGTSSQDKRFAQFSLSFGLNTGLANPLSGFIEYFGFYPVRSGTRNMHFLQTGIVSPLGRHFQSDARVGACLNRSTDDIFTGAGLSWRF